MVSIMKCPHKTLQLLGSSASSISLYHVERTREEQAVNWLFKYNKQTYVRQLQCSVIDLVHPAVSFINSAVEAVLNIPAGVGFRYYVNGTYISPETDLYEIISKNHTDMHVTLVGRLLGGKGGFGAQLRGQRGARKRVKNYDACRDLNGRRIRHANTMDRLAAWSEKKKQEDDLVEALGGEDVKETKTKSEAKLGGRGPTLMAIGQQYMSGLEVTQEKMLKALQRSTTSTSSSIRDISIVTGGEIKHDDTAASVKQRIAFLDRRFIGDFMDDDDEANSEEEEKELNAKTLVTATVSS